MFILHGKAERIETNRSYCENRLGSSLFCAAGVAGLYLMLSVVLFWIESLAVGFDALFFSVQALKVKVAASSNSIAFFISL